MSITFLVLKSGSLYLLTTFIQLPLPDLVITNLIPSSISWTSLVAQTIKCLSTMWETWVQSLGREVPWRSKWQPTPVLLPRKSHGQRSLVSMGSQRVRHDWATSRSRSFCLYDFCHFVCFTGTPVARRVHLNPFSIDTHMSYQISTSLEIRKIKAPSGKCTCRIRACS